MKSEDFISSFSFDKRLAPYDIQGSIAHVEMLSRRRILPLRDSKKIISGLKSIAKDINRGWRIPKAEDIHFAIENELVRRIGEAGKKMHTARSRNDQVALDLKLYVKAQGKEVLSRIKEVQSSILKCALANKEVVMPGFTHLQHGQPLFFSHHILAYAWMLERDKKRFLSCLERTDESPLGACALAGTSFPIDRKLTSRNLGFSRITENSVDTVSDRDFVAEFIFACDLMAVHFSRLAEDLVIWSSSEFDFARLPDDLTSGSSIMPNKRNPDAPELLRGKSGKLTGNLVHILTLLKGLPLSYNRDLQDDKAPLFDSVDVTLPALGIARRIFEGIRVNRKKMEESCGKGLLLATELADYLARKGVPFRKAHETVSKIAADSRKDPEISGDLRRLPLSILKTYSSHFEQDAYRLLSPSANADSKNSHGGTGGKALAFQIRKLKSLLK